MFPKQILAKVNKIFCTLFLLLCSNSVFSQNLVNNPSFENVTVANLECSWYLAQSTFNAAISNWTVPTDGTTDLFNNALATSCFCHPMSTDGSAVGQQAPRTGNGMSAIVNYGNGGCNPWREYLQGSLSSALVPGTQYCVTFYVSLGDASMYAASNMGVYFTTSAWSSSTGGCPYAATPQVNYTAPIITSKTTWTLISLSFTPAQAFTHFTIGNFYNDGATPFSNVSGSQGVTRYFIDDVSIQACNPNPVVTTTGDAICPGETATISASSTVAGTTFAWSNSANGASINVTPASTTTYTVTGTSPTGGTDSEIATVTVNTNPTVSATAAPVTICAGQSSTLTGNGASTYTWSPTGAGGSSISVTPTATATYIVTGTNAAGCTGTGQVTVNVNNAPTVNATASPTSICLGQCSNLTATGASGYTWMPGSLSGGTVSVCPSATTNYTVTGTSGGCTGTASVTVSLSGNLTVGLTTPTPTVCPGQCATITASGGTTYSWMPGSLTGSAVSVCPTTTTTYTVNANSVAGCTGSSTITITVASSPIVGATASPATICAGQSAVLTATGASTYSWNPGGLNGNSVTVNPATTTTYTVTATSVAGCTGTSQVTVNVTANPIISATATPASICIGDCSNLSATGATSYSWNPGSLSGTPVNVCPNSTTTYTVTGTTAACTGSNTVTISVSSPPVIAVSSPAPSICLGQCTDITVTGATSCTWLPGSLTGLTVSVCPTVTTTYTLTASNVAGCISTETYTITVNPLPVIGMSAVPSTICSGQCSNLLANGADTYQWSQSGATGDSTTVCPTITTAYTVTGTSLAACTATAQVNVTVVNLPGVVADALPDTLCMGQGTQLMAGGASTYLWTPGNMNGGSINVQPTQTTTYVVIGTMNGCSGLATVTVFVHPETEVVFISDTNNGCEDLLVHFYDLSAYPNATLLWNFGDGDTAMLTDTAEHLYIDPGTYDVSLTVIPENGCSESLAIPQMINVYPIPVADFILNPQPASIEYPEIHFFDQSSDAVTWLWNFGEPGVQENTSLDQFPSHSYSDTGTFVVTLVVSSMGCYDTAMTTLEIQPNVDVFIPNAFTPGTDALNMYFTCIGSGINESTYKMRIYDRWGKQLFFTTQVNPGWDGAINGKLVAQGTYVYMIDFIDVNANEHHYRGIVNVLR